MGNTALFVLLRGMRAPLLMLIGAYAIAVLGLVLVPGQAPDGTVEHMSFFHALYVISYTVTTIGFGEVPYPFTDAQRMWVVVSIYLGVIAWLYAIGALIALLQDSAIRHIIQAARFERSVRRMAERFFIVCGYGNTGSMLVRAMTEQQYSAVVLDTNPDRVNELTLENLSVYVPTLESNATLPDEMLRAGLMHPLCAGVVAVTAEDKVNLKIAITAKLLNPSIKVICRAQSHDTQANMESFGTDAVINHFDTFADRLAMALHSPDMYLIHEWLTMVPGEPLAHRVHPPHGTWVLCGYGRFGKAVQRYLNHEGVDTIIVEATPGKTNAPEGTIVGRGTEAETLHEARIETAVGIVAGTDDDTNNLSIIMTAKALNSNLFLVARQNRKENDAIFKVAGLDLVMMHSRVIAYRILALIRTPLLSDFLRLARYKDNQWANAMIEQLWPLIGNVAPELWGVRVDQQNAPALTAAISSDRKITLHHLLTDSRGVRTDRLPCLSLLLKRGEKEMLLPEEKTRLEVGDEILFCGREGAERIMSSVLYNDGALSYVETGEMIPAGRLWRALGLRT